MCHARHAQGQDHQEGALAAVLGVTLIISPVLMTQIFGYFANESAPVYLPGAPFLGAAVLMALALVPFGFGVRRMGNRRDDP